MCLQLQADSLDVECQETPDSLGTTMARQYPTIVLK